jgi:hypothetical protein
MLKLAAGGSCYRMGTRGGDFFVLMPTVEDVLSASGLHLGFPSIMAAKYGKGWINANTKSRQFQLWEDSSHG